MFLFDISSGFRLFSCCGSRESLVSSTKALEADIQHANTLAAEFPRDYDGACVQMRLSFSPVAHCFLWLVTWADVGLAGALGLMRIFIYKVYMDGTTTVGLHERRASLREFYGYLYPSLQQLQGVAELDDAKQKAICLERYKKADTEQSCMSDFEFELEQECGICMELHTKEGNKMIALPGCNHAMCIKCYREWHARSQSCPFCRDSLKRVASRDLWIFTETCEAADTATMAKDSLQRLFSYIDKLPLVVSERTFVVYDDAHLR
eukprot:TRINITY_DN20174_c0_g1_i1.p1 TRINITY_DN20174_c0_g1~~TRINITY_DN20174_c0_g1_i1.p1  ORF type:complete len:264 (-),score=35.79 TRINITY_DN20174_c0_g1_i1:903-1694(-)